MLIAAAALATVSCKDKDDDSKTTVSSYFSGIPSFSLPSFVQQGETYTLTPAEVEWASDDVRDESYGVIWRVNPVMSAPDTVRYAGEDPSLYGGSFEFTVPDTLCTLSVTCAVYAKGYYNTSATVTSIIIDPSEEGSLTGLACSETDFTDSRDGTRYGYVTVGSLDWMARNLAWDGAGHPFGDSDVMNSVFGRLYTWEEAVTACPEGWRLPDNSDWLSLANAVNGGLDSDALAVLHAVNGAIRAPEAYLNEIRLWDYQPAFSVTNSTGMNVLPVGYAIVREDSFNYRGLQEYSVFWTADDRDDDDAYYRYAHQSVNDLMLGYAGKKSFAAPVRCCRNN